MQPASESNFVQQWRGIFRLNKKAETVQESC